MEEYKIEQPRDILPSKDTELKDDDTTIYPKPRSGCRTCYGRGYSGWDTKTSYPVICKCILNRMGRPDVSYLTYGQLKKILTKVKDYELEKDTPSNIEATN